MNDSEKNRHNATPETNLLAHALSSVTGYQWVVGDWAIFDRGIVQIKEIRDYGCDVSDGMFTTSGRLIDRLRPLTLKNKAIAEYFAHYYDLLRKIDGEAGFNYPDISRHFSELTLTAVDGDPAASDAAHENAREFVREAKDYTPIIQGVSLFRRSLRGTA